MPLTARNSARRRRRKSPDEKLPVRREESTSSAAAAQVMEPTRMKLRVRRRDNASADATAAANQADEEERSRESGRRGSRRKTGGATSTAANASSWSPPPPPTSSSASARAAMAVAEEASPDSKCPICLDRFNNLAYLDRCLHRFCFPCIQEWSHNKAECPLCKQPFASILHSVRAEDDFKEYTLRPPPANSSVAATVAMVAAMASAARSDHQMRLMLRRHQGADGEEAATTAAARRRQRGRRSGVWEWYLDTPPLALPPLARHPNASPLVAEDSEEGEELGERRASAGSELAERGVIFEGLTGLSGAEAPVAPNDRAARRLMTRLMARRRLQREGGAVRRLRERETVALRRALYRSGIRVRGVAGADGNQGKQREITAESFLRNPTHLNRLRPWLRRELTVLYGTHGTLVDIVQRIIMARVARHGLEDTPTIEEELRQFLLARTDHFLHELVSFARSPLSLESYDLQAAYEPPDAAMELDGTSSSSDGSSVIAISEGEEEAGPAGGRSDEPPVGGAYDNDDVVPSGGGLSLSVWDDETPGPSYSSAEPSCSLAGPLFGHAPQEATNEERGGREEGAGGEEEECLIVGFKKPIAERTPELVQLSSDTDEGEKEKKEETEELPPLPASALCYLPTIPPSTSGSYGGEQEEGGPRARSLSGGSAGSGSSVLAVGPTAPGDGRRGGEEAKDRRRRRKRRKRIGRKRSGTLHNPNRSLYPAMLRHYSRSSSPLHSSGLGSGSPPSPPGSTWDSYHLSQVSPLSSSASSHSRCSSSSSSPFGSSPPPAPVASLSPGERGEKPGGKRKYKSRHLDDKDPTWRPSSREKGVGGGRSRDRQKRSVGERRSREDRSPSVEIVYEGTAPPPARKRRRKGQLGAQPSSSPVIITLDSDSSLDDDSSPISSQRTVDFSDLPPLPGPPPLILDRGSEVEPGGPVALDNISDVDVEGSPLGSDDDVERPIGKRDTSSADVSSKRHSEVLSSDSCLLATILSDLRGMAAPAAGFDPAHLPDASMTPPPPLERPREDVPPLERTWQDVPPLERPRVDVPPLERPREDVPPLERPRVDVPPLLTQASPVRSYVRDTPPPLKHKDDGCPRLSPVDLHSPPAAHIDSNAPPAASRPDCCHLAPVDPHLTAPRASPPPVNRCSSLPAAGLLRGGSREEPPRPSSPWGGCRDQTHGSGQVAPVDQRPPSGVSGGGGLSGVNCWDSSPSFASSIDFRNEDPPPAADPHPPLKRDALSPFSGRSVPTAPLGLSPGDLRPRPKPSVDLPPSSAAGPDGGAWPCLNSALNHAASPVDPHSKLRRSHQDADVPPNHRCPPRPRRDSRLPLDGGEGQWDTHADSAT